MKYFIQLILRLIYLGGVSLFAFSIGIFTFTAHGGSTIFITTLAIIYLLTFVPALIVGVLPVKTLASPPLILKVWYYFLGFLVVAFMFLQGAVQHGWVKQP
jgi:hypothetical protein